MKGASGNKPNYQLKHKLVGHDLGAVSVKFSPGGAWLASASADSTIRIWDPQSGKLIRTLKGHDKLSTSHVCKAQLPVKARTSRGSA